MTKVIFGSSERTKKMFASTVAKRYLKYRQEKLFCYGNSGCLTFCTQNAHRPHLEKKILKGKTRQVSKILNGKPGPGAWNFLYLFILSFFSGCQNLFQKSSFSILKAIKSRRLFENHQKCLI